MIRKSIKKILTNFLYLGLYIDILLQEAGLQTNSLRSRSGPEGSSRNKFFLGCMTGFHLIKIFYYSFIEHCIARLQ